MVPRGSNFTDYLWEMIPGAKVILGIGAAGHELLALERSLNYTWLLVFLTVISGFGVSFVGICEMYDFTYFIILLGNGVF